jgi:hypothetical protein
MKRGSASFFGVSLFGLLKKVIVEIVIVNCIMQMIIQVMKLRATSESSRTLGYYVIGSLNNSSLDLDKSFIIISSL